VDNSEEHVHIDIGVLRVKIRIFVDGYPGKTCTPEFEIHLKIAFL